MPFKHILVATDFDESAGHALELAIEIAQKFEAKLTLVHCWEVPSYSYGSALYVPADLLTPIEDAAQSRLNMALAELKKRVPGATAVLRAGPAAEEILAAGNAVRADLIVVGTHGRRGLSRVLLGSVAERVVRTAQIPVLSAHAETKKL